MKKVIFFAICILLLVALGIYVFKVLPNQRELAAVRNIKIENVNLQEIDDGIYRGSYTYGSYTYEVEVKVNDHKISEIDIVSNRDTSHSKKAEGIIIKVVEEQSLDVDIVAGATTTSKALLKSIENALKSALIEWLIYARLYICWFLKDR